MNEGQLHDSVYLFSTFPKRKLLKGIVEVCCVILNFLTKAIVYHCCDGVSEELL